MPDPSKPLVLITGAAGNIGRSLAAALAADYRLVGIDRGGVAGGPGSGGGSGPDFPILDVDLTRQPSIDAGLARLRAEHGARMASVIHLIAYFDLGTDLRASDRADLRARPAESSVLRVDLGGPGDAPSRRHGRRVPSYRRPAGRVAARCRDSDR